MKARTVRNLMFSLCVLVAVALWFAEGTWLYPFLVGLWVGLFGIGIAISLTMMFGGRQ